MRRRMIAVMAWVQILLSCGLTAAAALWCFTDVEPMRRWIFTAAYAVFGLAFLVDAVRDLLRPAKGAGWELRPEPYFKTYFTAPDGCEVGCDAKVVPAAGDTRQYICFSDGLRMIVENGEYAGWFFDRPPEGKEDRDE